MMLADELATDKPKVFMEDSMKRKRDVLEKEIQDIKSELDCRSLLHASLNNELAAGIETRQFEINRFGGWGQGSVFEPRINIIEREIFEVKRELRSEELNFWRDVSRLKESLRKVLKEYWQMQSREEFLDKYLNKINYFGGD
jgi:hypothetical protein